MASRYRKIVRGYKSFQLSQWISLTVVISLLVGYGITEALATRQQRDNLFPPSPPIKLQIFQSSTSTKAIPALAHWEAQMTRFGEKHCQKLTKQNLGDVYYDAARVYYQIADYTHDPFWKNCAQQAIAIYRDYVLSNKGKVKGYWIFPHGLGMHYARTGDSRSRDAVILMSQKAAYATDITPLSWTKPAERSREVAYNIMSYLVAEELGAPHRDRLEKLVDQALGHYDQWFVSQTAPYVRPFMASLTAEALIMYYEKTNDPRVLSAIKRGMDWLWEHTWIPEEKAFQYTDRKTKSGGTNPTPDLNLLIAPVYAWLYQQTGETKYRDWADQIFAGGAKGAYLHGTKQFLQNYRWSFAYVRIRQQRNPY